MTARKSGRLLRVSNRTLGLLVFCFLVWTITSIRPFNPEAWALEQVASLLCGFGYFYATRNMAISFISRFALCTLFTAHAIGTHFTYSQTPYDAFFLNLFSFSPNDLFGWERNHYDRFVHCLYGLTTTMPFSEFCRARWKTSARSALFLAITLVLATSAVYELMEWGAALFIANDSSTLYLGTQGDVWDAQADIALAGLGSTIAILLSVCCRLPHSLYKIDS